MPMMRGMLERHENRAEHVTKMQQKHSSWSMLDMVGRTGCGRVAGKRQIIFTMVCPVGRAGVMTG